jgi:beta-galactosidase
MPLSLYLQTGSPANLLPEIDPAYNDSKWIVCNKTATSGPVTPSTLPVLFSSNYGFYTGAKIYRGYFDSSTATYVDMTTSGGLSFGFNAWLNGNLIGGSPGNALLNTIISRLPFTSTTLKATRNALTVVVDHYGYDEASTGKGVKNPRGILGASLSIGTFTKWKL